MDRRRSDQEHEHEHEHCSKCPMTPEQVTQMLTDIRDMKRYFLIGRIVAWTIGGTAITLLWLFDRAEDIRTSITHFLNKEE